MKKSRNRRKHCKTQGKFSFFETKKPSQKELFLKLQKSCFLVCYWVSKKLIYLVFYNVLSDFNFFNVNKLLKSC